jgi:hypothetical protein
MLKSNSHIAQTDYTSFASGNIISHVGVIEVDHITSSKNHHS